MFFVRSDNSGLIPRSLYQIFQEVGDNQLETVSIYVSFLEIYKETAYDLLGPLLFKGPRKTKELPKVCFRENHITNERAW